MGHSMTSLTPAIIARTKSDERLFKLLGAELTHCLGPGPGGEDDIDDFVSRIRHLPQGLRAMAATYELDVSITLDDLGWHFANWHHLGLAQETLLGLKELGALEAAQLFEQALAIATAHWDFFAAPDFVERYTGSPVEEAFSPLNARFWEFFGSAPGSRKTLLDYWACYARAHPANVCGAT